jgi:hypothetical protein
MASAIFSLRVLRRPAHVAEHALELLGHLLHAGRAHDFHGGRGLRPLDLDLLVVQRALAQLLAEGLARRAVGGGALLPSALRAGGSSTSRMRSSAGPRRACGAGAWPARAPA